MEMDCEDGRWMELDQDRGQLEPSGSATRQPHFLVR